MEAVSVVLLEQQRQQQEPEPRSSASTSGAQGLKGHLEPPVNPNTTKSIFSVDACDFPISPQYVFLNTPDEAEIENLQARGSRPCPASLTMEAVSVAPVEQQRQQQEPEPRSSASTSGAQGLKGHLEPPSTTKNIFSVDACDCPISPQDTFLNILDEVEMENLQARGSGVHLLSIMLLVALPLVAGFTGFGVQVAVKRGTGFSIISPLFVASSILMVGYMIYLAVRFGSMEVKKFCSQRYLYCSALGCAGALKSILQNMAVSRMNSSIVFIILRTSMVWVAILEAAYLRTAPTLVKVMTLFIVLIASISYTLVVLEGQSMEASLVPIVWSLVAAFADAVLYILTDIACRRFTRGLEGLERQAEMTRILLVEQVWKVMCFALAMFLTEGPDHWKTEGGPFHGWDAMTFVLAVVPMILKSPVGCLSVMLSGAMKTSLANSFDTGASYIMEVVFGLALFRASNACLLLTCASVLVMSALHALDLQAEEAKTQSGIFDTIRVSVSSGRHRWSTAFIRASS
ncbi:unnamed protein product [Polarella glacialis]|uniref:Uncharacterized protein n=1 Tax=Polarella glacialis TaxID=89957 RepID=A0A813G1F4_POLGL|nr:unnamed protein product [Polarella glacialis]